MGNLLDEIREDHQPRKKLMAIILEKMPKGDRDDLVDAMRDPEIRTSSIHRVLQKRGIKVGYDRISEYRRELLSEESE
jgi:hypothetical protein